MSEWDHTCVRYERAGLFLIQAQTELALLNRYAVELGWKPQATTRQQDQALAALFEAHRALTAPVRESS